MVYHQTHRILALGDAREDGRLWAGFSKDRDGWTDYNKAIWVEPTLWNKIRLRWRGRHSIIWIRSATKWWELWK